MKLERLIMLSAMGTPGGGRTFISPRLIRHYNVICYTELDNNTINIIFTSLMSNFFKKFNEDVRNAAPKLIESVLSVYDQVR